MAFDNLVSCDWLAENISRPDVKPIDATFYLPAHGKDGRDQFAKQAIPGAVFFDLDRVCDTSSDLPHMMPTPLHMAQALTALAIDNRDTIVVYDQHGLFSAARLWWMLTVFGHQRVYVLNGGLPAWIADGHHLVQPGSCDPATGEAAPYEIAADQRADKICDIERLKSNPQLWSSVVDARPAQRFLGEVPEPRAGMRSGHIPGSINLPFTSLVKNGFLLPKSDLQKILSAIEMSCPIISCGSGVTAAILILALHEVDRPHCQLFDGSWAAWGHQNAGTAVTKSRIGL